MYDCYNIWSQVERKKEKKRMLNWEELDTRYHSTDFVTQTIRRFPNHFFLFLFFFLDFSA